MQDVPVPLGPRRIRRRPPPAVEPPVRRLPRSGSARSPMVAGRRDPAGGLDAGAPATSSWQDALGERRTPDPDGRGRLEPAPMRMGPSSHEAQDRVGAGIANGGGGGRRERSVLAPWGSADGGKIMSAPPSLPDRNATPSRAPARVRSTSPSRGGSGMATRCRSRSPRPTPAMRARSDAGAWLATACAGPARPSAEPAGSPAGVVLGSRHAGSGRSASGWPPRERPARTAVAATAAGPWRRPIPRVVVPAGGSPRPPRAPHPAAA